MTMILKDQHLQEVPKIFIESSLHGFGKEYLVLTFASGKSIYGFAINPVHYKQVVKGMLATIEQYEKEFGAIEETQAGPVTSPIQLSDLGGDTEK